MLAEIWQWLTTDETGRLIGAVAGLTAILGAILAAARAIAPGLRKALSNFIKISAGFWEHLRVGPKIRCAKLRLVVLYAGPHSLVRISRSSLVDSDTRSSSIAMALAFFGEEKEAKSVDPAAAAWGLALRRGPKEAIRFIEPMKGVRVDASVAYEGLSRLVKNFGNTNAASEWQRRQAMIVPFASIVEALAEDSTLLRLPFCLEDASRYLKSKEIKVDGLDMFRGKVSVGDVGILKPMDRRRLRALRHVSARKARCKTLPKIAANLAILAYAEATVRRNPSGPPHERLAPPLG